MVAKDIKTRKRNEKEDNSTKNVVKLGIVINITTTIIVEKHVKTQFIATWTLTNVKEVGDKFHPNFQTCL